MIKTVINSANPIKTELGGTCCVPTAVRRRAKTIMILKKEVTEIKKKGTSEIRARAKISCTLLENCGEAMISRTLRLMLMGARAWA
jgi:hypothetical protein